MKVSSNGSLFVENEIFLNVYLYVDKTLAGHCATNCYVAIILFHNVYVNRNSRQNLKVKQQLLASSITTKTSKVGLKFVKRTHKLFPNTQIVAIKQIPLAR